MFLLFAPNSRMDGELNEDDDVDAVFYGSSGGGQVLAHRKHSSPSFFLKHTQNEHMVRN